jgi:hypothetical protein
LGDVYGSQRAARLAAIQGIAGDPAKREAAVAARQAAAGPLYKQATNAVYELDSGIQSLLNTPIGRQAVQRAEQIAKNNQRPFQFVTESSAPFKGVGGAAPQTKTQVTGQALQDIKMAFDDLLQPNVMGGISKSEATAAGNIRGKMVDWMESVNPDFRAARQTFARESVPINTMDVADALMKKLQPALARYGATTKEQASAYAQALEAAKETVKKSTGINKPIDAVIDQKAKELLENIAKDLGRKVKAEDMGRAVGSNTAQNLSAQNLLRRTLGPTGLPQSWAESGFLQTLMAPYSALNRAAGTEGKVLGLLADAAQDPQLAARLLMQEAPVQRGLLGQVAARTSPAIGAGMLLSAPSQ